jgi:hypothetical protein
MGKLFAIHTLPSPATIEEVTPVAKTAKANSGSDAYWIGSWIQANAEGKATRIICEWDAKDIQSIQKVFEKVLKVVPGFPVDGIFPMLKVEAETYR